MWLPPRRIPGKKSKCPATPQKIRMHECPNRSQAAPGSASCRPACPWCMPFPPHTPFHSDEAVCKKPLSQEAWSPVRSPTLISEAGSGDCWDGRSQRSLSPRCCYWQLRCAQWKVHVPQSLLETGGVGGPTVCEQESLDSASMNAFKQS